jgi:hypothetical protein
MPRALHNIAIKPQNKQLKVFIAMYLKSREVDETINIAFES